ncbi:unnamed protein product [Oppiella nova]|uniref:SGNH hydrolase-type esterase domain-containing protein n=1 Tax=Oppiella nova TaxID=334625 RepID=A0A7R9M6S1_9ACAR|nr:unnamed protein product [Oppiella nova]CAG2171293.1 unnamed protein product [Oppiella nova]
MQIITILSLIIAIGETVAQTNPWDPQPGDGALWQVEHQILVDQTRRHGAEERIIFVGDSLTQFWLILGAPVWAIHYTPRHAYNYGIGGDMTQNVIFRIQNQEFDGLQPVVTVLMIGGNNFWHTNDTVADVAHGTQEIVNELLAKMPTTKIILLGNIPASIPGLNEKLQQHTALISKLANDRNVYFLDMWSHFLDTNQSQNLNLYISDGVHLNELGYQ